MLDGDRDEAQAALYTVLWTDLELAVECARASDSSGAMRGGGVGVADEDEEDEEEEEAEGCGG